ncbi:hypothetical protein OAM92_00330 [Acidimicrobiales bacterium]|nr:hypothetical protein [Acidimicrobiales bacterium]
MSLIYRAIWQDDRPEIHKIVKTAFSQWIAGKHPAIEVPDDGEARSENNGAAIRVDVKCRSDQAVSASEFVLTEDRPDERWSTRTRVLTDEQAAEAWIWVDLERVASDPFRTAEVTAPRLVRNLIKSGRAAGGRPRIGPAPLSVKALAIRADDFERDLIGFLEDRGRISPIVLFSHKADDDPRITMRRAQTAAEILAGVASVFVLPPETQQRFQDHVGRDMSVWGGAARMYLPGAAQPARHRYIPAEIVARHQREAGRRFAEMLSGSITARRAPELFIKARSLLRHSNDGSIGELLDLAEDEIDVLRTQLEAERDLRIGTLADMEAVQEELLAERRIVRALLHTKESDTASFDIPDTAESLSDVADLCRAHLSNVVLDASACQDLTELDRVIEADAWARSAWQGLRALDAYAAEAGHFKGGFWLWCENTSNVDRWPATSKKLAMSESDSVKNDPRLRACRNLPVAKEVDPSGFQFMQAHLKIAEGGGPLAPRIYFHDDTGGITGKIHIGFFGPHRHMPNTKTN